MLYDIMGVFGPSFFMIIPTEELFDNTVFKVNTDMIVNTIETVDGKITILDNFYEDIESVLKQIDKLPMTTVWNNKKNNVTYLDARKSHPNNMEGTFLPYTVDGMLQTLVADIVDYNPKNITIDQKLLVNCFKFTDEFNLEDYYYSAHTDPYSERSPGQLAIVVFLNRHYEEGEGMNFYDDLPGRDEEYRTRKDLMTVVKTIQGKCNRAVLFDSLFPHGQHTPTEQFKKEMRYTQVVFLYLW